jgi:hypothetical protein
MAPSICSYCQQQATFTKEHLWPAALHKRLFVANQQTSNTFWLARLQREIPAEPQIRDVCAHCNNVVLSELDSYICALFDKTFVRILKRHEKVQFDYNYHLLKRWLLKMSYNSARIHNSVDRKALETLRPYILGTGDHLGRSAQLFVQLTYPEEVNKRELDSACESNETLVFQPSMNRVGHMLFRAHGIGQKLLRTVHLRSYSFFVAYWPPGGSRNEQDDFETVFRNSHASAQLLRPSRPAICLECNGFGAWDSFRESRSTQFVFDDDA